MKKIYYTISILVSILAIISCGKDTKKQQKTPSVQTVEKKEKDIKIEKDIDRTATRSEVVFTDIYIDAVYKQYLLVKKGLVNSNVKLVQQEAKKLKELIKDNDISKQLKSTAELMSLTKRIDKQRDFFVTLTAETTKLVSDAAITSGAVYQQFCPMAFEGAGGYWLSDSKEVRNPYYGTSMLQCGHVKETIQ